MRLNVFNSLMGLCVATAAVSCSDGLVEDNLHPVGGESDMISFVVANENNATRGGSLGNRPCGGAILRSSDGADSLYLNMSVADITDDLNTRASQITDAAELSRLNMTCVIRTINDVYTSYFENVAFNKNGSVWSSDTPYYWFENETHYKFYGYYTPGTPEDSGVEFIPGTSENKFAPSIKYTVNEDVDKQFDLSYSAPSTTEKGLEYEYISSSATNPAVGLSIKHALSKIAFKTGEGMAAGTISSVSIKQVCGNGTLNLGTGDWDLSNVEKKDFSLSGLNVSGDKQDITGSNYFMLLPNTKEDEEGNKTSLTDNQGAEIEVEFTPAGAQPNTPPEKYTASINDVEWIAGKSYTYTINIKPDDPEISIELTEGYRVVNNEYMVDAHYVIAKAKVNVLEGAKSKNWTLGASATDKDGNEVDVTFVRAANNTYKDFISYYDQGYWLDTYTKGNKVTSARGTSTETVSADDEVYIFIPENASANADIRVININLINKDGSTQLLKSIKQLPPAWNESGLGVERFEDGDYPWGFSWDSNATITYQKKGTSSGILGFAEGVIHSYQAWLFENRVKHPSYVTSHYEWPTWTVTINCSGITKPTTADDEINGKSNTWNILNFTGIDELDNAIAQLVSWRLKPIDENEIDNPLDFAARACAMKNKYNIEYSGSNGDQNSYDLKFNENDLVWYLPAVNEAANMKDEKFNLDGNYWTSTAIIDPGTTAYQFTYGGSSSGEKRSYKLHVRACRQRN